MNSQSQSQTSQEAKAQSAAAEYISLRDRRTNPAGEFDKHDRFYTAERGRCCVWIRSPSARFPYSQLVHARTLATWPASGAPIRSASGTGSGRSSSLAATRRPRARPRRRRRPGARRSRPSWRPARRSRPLSSRRIRPTADARSAPSGRRAIGSSVRRAVHPTTPIAPSTAGSARGMGAGRSWRRPWRCRGRLEIWKDGALPRRGRYTVLYPIVSEGAFCVLRTGTGDMVVLETPEGVEIGHALLPGAPGHDLAASRGIPGCSPNGEARTLAAWRALCAEWRARWA